MLGRFPLWQGVKPTSLHCLTMSCQACGESFLQTNENGFRSDCRYKTQWFRAHSPLVYLHAQSQRKGKKREKNFFNFLLIAALPDTHVVRSAISYFMLGKLTHKHIDTRTLRRHCLKAECWFANELSWWLILPFNWLVKGAIRIQCIDAHQERKTVGLGCLYIMCETVRFKVKHTLEHRRHVTHSLLLLLFILIMLLNCSMIWSMNLPVSVNTCGLLCMQGVSFSSSSLFLVYFSSIAALHSFSFQS